MRYPLILSIILLFQTLGVAQTRDTIKSYVNKQNYIQLDGETVSYSLKTPYHTVYTHLFFLQHDNYYPEVAAKVFNLNDEEFAKKSAIQLKQILDGKGMYVDLEAIPKEPNHIDSTSNLARYVLFKEYPDIYLEKVEDRWYYSRRTVEVLPDIHAKVYPLGSEFLMNLMPQKGKKEFMGLELWQYLGILLFAIVIMILRRIFTVTIEWVIQRASKQMETLAEHADLVHKVAIPLSWVVLTLLIVEFIPALQFPISISKYLVAFLSVLTPFFAMVAGYRAVDILSFYLVKWAAKTAGTLDDQLVPLLSKTLKFLILIVGVLIILHVLNFNITAILAGVSIGGLAIALAAQDTIKNLFGSLMIFVDRPFQIGDGITFDGNSGAIEEVGFRSTRIRTFENSLIYVPNGQLANTVIDNKGLRIYRRYKAMIALTYDTPPDLIEKFVEGLREIVTNHPQTRKDAFEIHLNDMADASLNILFYIFFEVPDWSTELKSRHEVILAILRLAEDLGVRFAFPTQTIHVEEFPEKKALSPQYDTDPEHIDKKLATFMENYKQQIK